MIHAHLRAVMVGGICIFCFGTACLGAAGTEATSARVTGLDFTSAPQLLIPDDDPRGVSDTIAVVPSAPLGPVTSVAVDVEVLHPRANEVEVVLEHAGAREILHAGGGSVRADLVRRVVCNDAFDGLAPWGDWVLHVYDGAARDWGTLVRWSLHLEVEGDPSQEAEVRMDARADLAAGLPIPDGDRSGITSSLLVASPVQDAFVTRVTVDVAIRHPDIGDLRVSLVHEGQRVLLHNRTGARTENLSRSYTVDAAFDRLDASGTWILEVADEVNVDVGVLAGWEAHVYASTGGTVPTDPSWDLTSIPQVRIPDGDPAGVTDTIRIPFWDEWLAIPWRERRLSVLVDVDVEHEFVGDLVVSLEHHGRSALLQQRRGGAQTNLVRTFRIDSFAHAAVDGDWTLRVADAARIDIGTFRSWRLRIELVE